MIKTQFTPYGKDDMLEKRQYIEKWTDITDRRKDPIKVMTTAQ